MIIIYAPEDGTPRRWDLKEIRILATEAEAVERVTDLDWATARTKIVRGSMLALRAVAWVLAKRDQPDLRYAAFIPAASELGWAWNAEERAAIRQSVADNDELDPEVRAATLAEMDATEAELTAEEQAGDEDPESVPKASEPEASPTSG